MKTPIITDTIFETLINTFNFDCPSFIVDSIIFEAKAGSFSYGCQDPNSSDEDIVGICIPPPEIRDPWLHGSYIPGFGRQPKLFEQYQKHHIGDYYDVTIYNLTKFCHLAMGNNPNIVDVLFSSDNAITYLSPEGEYLRNNRHKFLSKKCWHTFRGYAHGQLKKIENINKTAPRRQAAIAQYGYDTKFAYHIVRLMLECEQILLTGDLILDKDKETYIEIRNGEWTLDEIRRFFQEKTEFIDKEILKNSTLRDQTDENEIALILMNCWEIKKQCQL